MAHTSAISQAISAADAFPIDETNATPQCTTNDMAHTSAIS